ncbi:MAG: LLM class flavin-dependent oxidoreductase [Armatimonadota bacterium]|nr:LLM class flavin-dependent oxidoreductase [Armatimonadota bacterium]
MRRPALGFLFLGEHPPSALQHLVRTCEALGADVFWLADEKFYRDPFVGLAAAALSSTRIHLGTCVTEPYTRHPALLAMAIGTLDEVAGGRAILGLGAGGSGFPAMGVRRTHPARTVTEAVALLRRLLSGERVTFAGTRFRFREGRLHFRPRPDIPIFVAARGRGMLRAAGGVADGVIVAPYASEPGLRFALEQVHAGARSAGRDPAGLDVAARVDVCIAEDPTVAREAIRPAVALPLWISYPNLSYLDPLPVPPPPAALLDVLARREYDLIPEAARLVPDSYLDHLAVAGTAEQVRDRLQRLLACGISHLLLRPIPPPDGDLPETLGQVAAVARAAAAGEAACCTGADRP